MFRVLTISPVSLAPVRLVVASARAGGIGIIDLEFERETQADSALRQLEQILGLIPEGAPLGLRFYAMQVSWSQPLLSWLASRPHLLVLCGWAETGLASAVASLPSSGFRELIVEVKDIDELAMLEESKIHVDGIIGKGHESGGWIGDSPAFILGQQLLARVSLPVIRQGGIGPNTSAACYTACTRFPTRTTSRDAVPHRSGTDDTRQ